MNGGDNLARAWQELADDDAWLPFRERTLVLTGASGVVGSVLAAVIGRLNEARGLDIKLVGTGRGHAPAGWAAPWVRWDVTRPAPANLGEIAGLGAVVVHAAAVTTSRSMVDEPDLVRRCLVDGTRHALDWASGHGASRFVYLSSIEAFGTFLRRPNGAAALVTESDTGYIDESDKRSCYPLGKRDAEELCRTRARKGDIHTVILRPGQVIGIGVRRDDPRVFATFVRSALAGEHIVLRSDGQGFLNPVDSLDLVSGLALAGGAGAAGETLTLVDDRASRTVIDAARDVQRIVGRGGGVRVEVVDRATTGYAPPQGGVFLADRARSLGWRPRASFEEAILRTANCWGSDAGHIRLGG